MATANVRTGKGGLDGSLQYQLDDGESKGPGFNSTFKFFSDYLSKRSSLADLIALGVYASPEHSIEQFREQFSRMGFTDEEMIQVTACGHTIGGVHDTEFPELAHEGEAPSDSTVAMFDEKVITEYLDNNTTNPLVVGPAVGQGKDSDARIFASDSNVTVKAMADPQRFQDVCRKVLQKMIEVVPKGSTLSQPIEPYMVKPVDLRLSLEQAARHLQLSGNIRVRTTNLPAKEITQMEILYKNRGYGLDDSFAFFPIDATIPVETGISSFTVALSLANGTRIAFENNGQDYPMQDAVILLRRQTCLLQHTGKISVTAAVRNDRTDLPTNLTISYKVPRPGLPVAGLRETAMAMARGACVGPYTLYTADWKIPGGISYSSRTDVSNGEGGSLLVDDFTYGADLHGQCEEYTAPPASMFVSTTSTRVVPSSTADSSLAPTAGGHEFSKSIFRPVSGSIWETFMQYFNSIW
ncbi:putative l-ascorbate peroxidase [Diaporthe ampelina]|uniref:Peroxidase n=1 Tax=Diaporthe ampelina TaxID=1214573 RepID=A0A0G2HW19_9PEZI|nr:putative l-ascorbate peroxidase [Diaporthe ampelina]